MFIFIVPILIDITGGWFELQESGLRVGLLLLLQRAAEAQAAEPKPAKAAETPEGGKKGKKDKKAAPAPAVDDVAGPAAWEQLVDVAASLAQQVRRFLRCLWALLQRYALVLKFNLATEPLVACSAFLRGAALRVTSDAVAPAVPWLCSSSHMAGVQFYCTIARAVAQSQ